MSLADQIARLFVPGARKSASGAPALVGAAAPVSLPAAAPSIDPRARIPYIRNQFDDRCVGISLASASYWAVGCEGTPGSDLCVWTGARAREGAAKGAPLTDVGCIPYDAVDGMIASGVYARDYRDDLPSEDCKPETIAEVIAAYKHRVAASNFVVLDPSQVATLHQWETLGAQRAAGGIGAMFIMEVDANYMALSPSNPVYTPGGAQVGGHAQVHIGYLDYNGTPCELVWGSWGTQFGLGGFTFIPSAIFPQVASQIVVVTGGPVLS